MHASFETGAACHKIVAVRGSARDEELLQQQQRIDEAHEAQMTNLTRLRLLSTAEVVTAAHELREPGHEVADLSVGDGDAEEIDHARQRLREARDQMVMASRKAMRVPDPGGTSLAGL